MTYAIRTLGIALTVAVGLLPSCRNRPQQDRTEAPAAQPQSPAPTRSSARLAVRPWRALLSEAARAELDLGGVHIDFGTVDQHKYTRGGWNTGWGPTDRDSDGTNFAAIIAKRAWLEGLAPSLPPMVALRVRTAGKAQKLAVEINGHAYGTIDITPEWSVQHVELAAGALKNPDQRWRMQLRRKSQDPKTAVFVDWVRLARDPAQVAEDPGPRVGGLRVGGTARRALLAPTPRHYWFYLRIPERARLIFDAGVTAAEAEFTVRAQTDDGITHELLRTRANQDAWAEHVVDLNRFAGQALRLELATTGHSGSAGWGEPVIQVEPVAEPAAAARDLGAQPRAKNLIMVVMDTTRADAFAHVTPGNQVQTPELDGFAKDATAFVNAYNNENWTKPSVATMLSGLYPGTHNSRTARSSLPDDIQLLPEHLQQHGFTTAAYISNAVVNKRFGFHRGWGTFNNYASTDEADSEYLYRNAAAWLRDHDDGRFFLYIQSIDPHTPYEVDRRYTTSYFADSYEGFVGESFSRDEQSRINRSKVRFNKTDLAWIRALHNGEVTYQDEHLGDFLRQVEQLGLLDETLVVITNDHGEEFYEHGQMGHGYSLYETLLRAPLVIRYPHLFPSGKHVDAIIEHVDLAPTLLEALGIEPMSDIEGVSFLPLVAGEPAALQPPYHVAWSRGEMRSLRVGPWKLIVDESKGWIELYNVEADPQEQSNLKDTHPIAGRLCDIHLGEALASPNKLTRLQDTQDRRFYKTREVDLDPKTRRQLEALGYL